MSARNFTVYWTKSAQDDLTGILKYISFSSIDRSRKTYELVRNYAGRLKSFPYRGTGVPEVFYFGIENYKQIIVAHLRMIYRVEEERVIVMALFEEKRSVEDILLRRALRDY
jgi:plasmid stabilization system protein ParE